MNPKYSIVIGTYNKLEECLKPCVDSILKYTTLNDFSTELIIVANGCTDGTANYILSLQRQFHNIHLLWYDEALGFTRAYNEGIRAARGEYVVLFNNDNILLDQPYNQWLEILVKPFEDGSVAKVGITGPMKEHCPHADRDFILFFCAMIPRRLFDEVGMLDEIFSPGYGEDTDYNARLENAGYKIVQVPDDSRNFYDTNKRTGVFPLFHAGNMTFKNWPGGEELLARNNKILKDRYAKVDKISPVMQMEPSYEIRIGKALQCDGFMSFQELEWLGTRASESQVVIEVGSWHGRSSRAIADNLPEGAKLYCVDHWDGSAVERDTNHASARLNEGDHAFMEFCDNMADHIEDGTVIPIRMSSKNAAAWFTKHNIKADFLFIDAGHMYEDVKEDLNLWHPLVVENGIISGHDYWHGPDNSAWPGVKKAVDEHFNYEVGYQPKCSIWSVKNVTGSTGTQGSISPPIVVNQKVNIYDCFPFFNELDILDIRFAEMYDVVDRFVIVEATLTHGGKEKPLYFTENLDRYGKYLHKVTHIVVDEYPALDSWSIERHQRNQILRGLTDCKDEDIIVVTDADEIPRAGKVYEFNHAKSIMQLDQDLFYYKINCKSTLKWGLSKIASYKEVKEKTPCGIRYWQNYGDTIIKDAGWHFSYLGSTTRIIEKLEATAHQEYNTVEMKDLGRIEKVVSEGKDLFGRPLEYNFVEVDSTYPKYILDNLEDFKQKGLVAEVTVCKPQKRQVKRKPVLR